MWCIALRGKGCHLEEFRRPAYVMTDVVFAINPAHFEDAG